MKRTLGIVLAALLLNGCDQIKAKPHMLPNQDEQECLNSERLRFKDPDVLFVANLGNRGWTKLPPNTYWVRYKAKNSYGAYLQGNMLCTQRNGAWVRDSQNEILIKLELTGALMDIQNERLRKQEPMSSRYRGKKFDEAAFEEATELMEESPDPLGKYMPPA